MREIAVFVINLDRAPDRMDRMREQLDSVPMPFERFPAVEGAALGETERADFDEAAFHRKHGMQVVAGEIGCYLSHVRVMRRFLETDAAAALILEDDVELSPDLPKVLDGLMGQAERWDMVQLSAVHKGLRIQLDEVVPGVRLSTMLSHAAGSSAYVVNRVAAERYVKGLLPMSVPYDHAYDHGWRFGLKVRTVTPAPCGHIRDGETTMVGYATRRKFPWYKRGSVLAYRTGRELSRWTYAIGQAIKDRSSKR